MGKHDVSKICGLALSQRLFVRIIIFLWMANNVEHHVICLNMKGKVGLICAVYIPKLIITSILTLTGSLWLVASESISDLILNSLALAFVVKVDEIIATTFF